MARQGRVMSDHAAESIVQEVGGLPLAIRQIGSYIAATNLEPSEFLQRYQWDRATASSVDEWDDSIPLSYVHTLATVWKFAFDRLSEEAISALSMLSFLDLGSIPQELFDHGITDHSTKSPFGSRIE